MPACYINNAKYRLLDKTMVKRIRMLSNVDSLVWTCKSSNSGIKGRFSSSTSADQLTSRDIISPSLIRISQSFIFAVVLSALVNSAIYPCFRDRTTYHNFFLCYGWNIPTYVPSPQSCRQAFAFYQAEASLDCIRQERPCTYRFRGDMLQWQEDA